MSNDPEATRQLGRNNEAPTVRIFITYGTPMAQSLAARDLLGCADKSAIWKLGDSMGLREWLQNRWAQYRSLYWQTQAESYEQQLALKPTRALRDWERMLLSELLAAANLPTLGTSDSDCTVREMLDGGMGSLRFSVPRGEHQSLGVSALCYTDSDGVPVLFELNLNEAGEPWEIDACKADSSPLIRPPASPSELSKLPPDPN